MTGFQPCPIKEGEKKELLWAEIILPRSLSVRPILFSQFNEQRRIEQFDDRKLKYTFKERKSSFKLANAIMRPVGLLNV